MNQRKSHLSTPSDVVRQYLPAFLEWRRTDGHRVGVSMKPVRPPVEATFRASVDEFLKRRGHDNAL